MTLNKRVKELNKRFGNYFGFKYGRPQFAWMNSEDLKVPVPPGEYTTAAGVIYMTDKPEMARQIEGPPRWLLVKLVEPVSEREWSAQYGRIPYPGRGYYVATDMILKVGAEPSDSLTDEMVGLIKTALSKTPQQHLEAAQKLYDDKQAESQRITNDTIEDAIPAFGNLPGRKEHVSFPSQITGAND
jgi:hypothetical protein